MTIGSPALVGLLAGLAATACMTGWEMLFFRRHGLEACLDWEVNQHLVSRVNGKAPEANMAEGLAMHFIVGAGVGVAFVLLAGEGSTPAIAWIGLVVGLALWGLLLPMRKFATGHGLSAGRLGWMPTLVSLAGHAIYGVVLAAAVIQLRGQ